MKRFKKPTLIIVALLVVISVLRETGVINLNYYSSEFKTNTHANWSNNSTTVGVPLEGFHTKFTDVKHADTPIVVVYKKDTLFFKKGSGELMEINIEDIETGVLWTPLYKSAPVNTTVHVSHSSSAIKVKGQHIMANGKAEPAIYNCQTNISGSITCTGNFTCKGICSRRTALEIIKKEVGNKIAAQAERYLRSLD